MVVGVLLFFSKAATELILTTIYNLLDCACFQSYVVCAHVVVSNTFQSTVAHELKLSIVQVLCECVRV